MPGCSSSRIELNRLHQWLPTTDKFMKMETSIRAVKDIKFFSGMSDNDMKKDLENRKVVLNWFVKKGLKDIHKVGQIISLCSVDFEKVLEAIKKGKEPKIER